MSLRITQNMLNQNMLFNLQRNNKAMDILQQQASSGKKINKPSDDPVTAVRGMFFRSSLNEVDQYKRNADDGYSWLVGTDEALNEVTGVLQRVKELTIQGQNGTNSPTDREAIAKEIIQLKEHLGDIANTQMAGKYIFAGSDVKKAPFDTETKEFVNDNKEAIVLQVGQTNNVQINVTGIDVFNNDGSGGIFKVLSDIVNDLQSPSNTFSENLSKLDNQLDNILRERAELGARTNRMELSISRLDGLEISTTRLLSVEEDVDMAQIITNLKTQENVQRAALAIGARIIQPSLVDFLR